VGIEMLERTDIADAMRRSVLRSGLTQRNFARSIGTSAPRLSTYVSGKTIPSAAIYLRATRLGHALELARKHGLLTPDTTAEAVNRALAESDEDFAIRLVLQSRDDLLASADESSELRWAWGRRSQQIEDDRFDTLYRAIIAHEFGEPVPAWAADAQLAKDWVVEDPFRTPEQIRAQTPAWLARARIYITERGLATA
jgi:transcriptional regulator with XRE-family HTH domain